VVYGEAVLPTARSTPFEPHNVCHREIPFLGRLESPAELQRVLHVEVEQVRIGGCVVRPVAELHDEQHTGHRIQLFGGPSHGGIKVRCQFLCGHQLQNGVPKQMLPPARESSIGNRRKKAFELDKQACLTRIFQIPQLTAP